MKPSDIKKQLESISLNLQRLFADYAYDLACYDKYFSLPATERARIRREWDSYYEQCRASRSGQAYFAQLETFKSGDMATMREMAGQARHRIGNQPSVTAPRFPVDPVAFDHASLYVSYRTLLSRKRELEKRQSTEGQSFDL